MSYKAAVITISDKGFAGQRVDTSGPALCQILKENGWEVIYTSILPDEKEQIQTELIKCADELHPALVLTTGGTGFSPRDVTPEATMAVVERPTPGIPEAMRAESMKITDRGCLSRSAAGIRGRTLIINLPGSEKAARENLLAVLSPIRHGLEMLLGEGSADCAGHHHHHHHHHHHKKPSMDQWMAQAKADPNAPQNGMYLFHNGVVRATAKAQVREGVSSEAVTGMEFSYDEEVLHTLVEQAKALPGIFHVRVWLNQGHLKVGDDIMLVLIGGDIRPHVVQALEWLVGRIKDECVRELEVN